VRADMSAVDSVAVNFTFLVVSVFEINVKTIRSLLSSGDPFETECQNVRADMSAVDSLAVNFTFLVVSVFEINVKTIRSLLSNGSY
jgi:hypothetical protein